jgi:putative membrane protein
VLVVACVFAALAALVHVYIFALESVRWQHPATRKVFGTTAEAAEITAPLAYNQGFYNLFLAIGTAVGIALINSNRDAGVALIVLGVGSMLAAALVCSSPRTCPSCEQRSCRGSSPHSRCCRWWSGRSSPVPVAPRGG